MPENFYEAFLGAYNQGQQAKNDKAKLAAQQMFQQQQLQSQQQQQSFDNAAEQQRIVIAQQNADIMATHDKALEDASKSKILADGQKEQWKQDYMTRKLEQDNKFKQSNLTLGAQKVWNAAFEQAQNRFVSPEDAAKEADIAMGQFDLGLGVAALTGKGELQFGKDVSPLGKAKLGNLSANTDYIKANTDVANAREDNIKAATVIANAKGKYAADTAKAQLDEIISKTALNEGRKAQLTLESAKIQAETAKIYKSIEKTQQEIEIDKNLQGLKGDALALYMAGNRKGVGDVQEKLRKGATEAADAVRKTANAITEKDSKIKAHDVNINKWNALHRGMTTPGASITVGNQTFTKEFIESQTESEKTARKSIEQERLLLVKQQQWLSGAADDASRRYNSLVSKIYGTPAKDTNRPQHRVTGTDGGYDKKATEAASRAAANAAKNGAPGLPKIAPPPAAAIHQNTPLLKPGKKKLSGMSTEELWKRLAK